MKREINFTRTKNQFKENIIILEYIEDGIRYYSGKYNGRNVKEAVSAFRKENGLQGLHIEVREN